MAVQGEQGQGIIEMDLEMIESMAQDEMTVQDIPIMQVEFPPQTNPESEMGAAAAAIDTPLLRQNPVLVPSETATDNGGLVRLESSDIKQLMQMIQAMSGDM